MTRKTKTARCVLTRVDFYALADPSQPARKKSKAEVMAEVIAKSKGHKVCILSTSKLLYVLTALLPDATTNGARQRG